MTPHLETHFGQNADKATSWIASCHDATKRGETARTVDALTAASGTFVRQHRSQRRCAQRGTFDFASARSTASTTSVTAALRVLASPVFVVTSSSVTAHRHELGPSPSKIR